MKINSVVGIPNAITGRSFAFERRLKKTEKKEYAAAINNAMDYLGVQNRALIIHGPSFPAKSGENMDKSMGSPYNNKEFTEFLKLHGFNGIQLGPTGKLNRGDASPYSSSVFAKNPLFIDFSMLKDKKYASILSDEDINEFEVPIEHVEENYTRANYKQAELAVENLTERAYDNYLDKLEAADSSALKLQKEFKKFKSENDYWLDYYSVLDVLAEHYGTDYYPNWNKVDSLLIQNVKKNDAGAIKYYNDIKRENAYDIEKYKFAQFIIDKQTIEDNKKRGDFTYISDLLVGVSSFDEMIFGDVFLDGWKIGANGGGVMDSPQLWNISVVDPNKLFNQDGSLGPSGEFVKLKIKKALQDSSNLRIDHAFGLVNPYLYRPDSIHNVTVYENGNSFEIPDKNRLRSGFLSELNIDRYNSFQRIVPEIVVPTLQEMGVDPRQAVWEDLGHDTTGKYDEVCRRGLGLPGISVLLWRRGEEAPKNNWAYLGCHDNSPLRQGIESGKEMRKHPNVWNSEYLSGYLNPGSNNQPARDSYKRKIEISPKEMWKAKLTELFRSTKNVQISFMDFFGINKRYNVPGTVSDDNWTLRMTQDWEDKYYKALEDGNNKDWAMNMPEILSEAVRAKAEMEIAKNENQMSDNEKANIYNEAREIMRPLNKYSQILKEKE